jgi:hypothetical protein
VQLLLLCIGLVETFTPIDRWIERHWKIPDYILVPISLLLLIQFGLRRRLPIDPDEGRRGFPVIESNQPKRSNQKPENYE